MLKSRLPLWRGLLRDTRGNIVMIVAAVFPLIIGAAGLAVDATEWYVQKRNIQNAAQGTSDVSSNIADVQRGAGETGAASAQVHSSAKSLSRDSNRLKLEVEKFLDSVRAA